MKLQILMDYLSISWTTFIEHKWTNLEQIADSTFFNTNATLLTSEMIISELTNKPSEVLIALTYPKRNYKSTFEHLSQALDEIFLNLGKPFLKAAYKIKVTPYPLNVAVMKWETAQEDGGLLSWIDDDGIILINNEHIFKILSEFHLYCHGREQQNVQLNSEAAQNALDLQEIMDILDNPPALTLECPQTDLIQNNITCNDSLSNASTDLSTSVIPSVTLSSDNFPTDNCDYKLIKSSKGHDKLSHEGFIYNFQREDSVKKQWRCQVKTVGGVYIQNQQISLK